MSRGGRGRGYSSFKRSSGHYRGNYRGGYSNYRGGRGRGRGGGPTNSAPPPDRGDDGTRQEERFEEIQVRNDVDAKLGFIKLEEGPKKEGWLINMHPVSPLYLGDP